MATPTATELAELEAQRARNRERYIELGDLARAQPPEPAELAAVNRTIREASALADRNPLFAAARSIAVHRPVTALEPGGAHPLLPITEATSDTAKLLAMWRNYPEANVGIIAGRLSRVIALQLDGNVDQSPTPTGRECQRCGRPMRSNEPLCSAYCRLADLATLRFRIPDDDRTYAEQQSLDSARIEIGHIPASMRFRTTGGMWGKAELADASLKMWEDRQPNITVVYRLFSYPDAEQDHYEYRSRELAKGVKLLANGEIILAAGRLSDGQEARGEIGIPPAVPRWFEAKSVIQNAFGSDLVV